MFGHRTGGSPLEYRIGFFAFHSIFQVNISLVCGFRAVDRSKVSGHGTFISVTHEVDLASRVYRYHPLLLRALCSMHGYIIQPVIITTNSISIALAALHRAIIALVLLLDMHG